MEDQNKPTEYQMQGIARIEETLFVKFRGTTEEDADRFLAEYWKEAVRLGHTQTIEKRKKSRNYWHGRKRKQGTVFACIN